jgi:hypothetical protein
MGRAVINHNHGSMVVKPQKELLWLCRCDPKFGSNAPLKPNDESGSCYELLQRLCQLADQPKSRFTVNGRVTRCVLSSFVSQTKIAATPPTAMLFPMLFPGF